MAIIGQNSLLNQYVPTFFIKNLRDGQGITYDSTRKAFVNTDVGGGSGGATRLGELIDVSPTVDNPLALHNGQVLVYNSFTSLWENTYTDYNTLLNKPTSSSFSFAGLSDTATPSLPNGYVQWNSTGTQLVYSSSIPAASINGLATVATTGDYNDLLNLPPTSAGTVTTVSITTAHGISGTVATPSTTPAITLTLGAITPTSVTSTGLVSGTNLSGINTGDQTILLSGDVTGSGTGAFGTTLATVNTTTGTFGNSVTVPQFTVDGKGRITNVINVPISTAGVGTVTSVAASGTQGVTTLILNATTTPSITIGLGAITPTSVAASGTVSGSNLSGNNTGDQTITLTGDVTGSGTGSFATSLSTTGVTPSTYTNPTIAIDAHGRITSATNGTSGTGSVTSVSITSANGISGSVLNPSTTPAITLTLGAITPTSVAATGTVTGSNLSGTSSGSNTGDQTITLTGDITGTGTSSFATALSATGVIPASYGSSTQIPTFVVDSKGRITSVTNVAVSSGTGTVTSVGVSGGTTGLTTSNSPITTSGVITLGGTLNVANGGTGVSTLTGYVKGTGTTAFTASATIPGADIAGNIAGNAANVTGIVALANGGTGQTSAANAINALVPTQTGNNGRFLTTNGSVVSWAAISGTGTVTSVGISGANGITVASSPITTSGTIALSLGAITPTSIASTGTVTGTNLSGNNTGDQTITLTGDVTGSGTGSFATALSATGVVAGAYTNTNITVDAHGRITSAANGSGGGTTTALREIVVFHYSSGGAGNFTPADAIFSQTSGVTATVTDATNCIATYAFTGKTNPPKSIITYGQVYAANTFTIKDTTSLPSAFITGGGTSASPDLANGLFSASNILTLQTRMSDTGASSGLGQRAYLVIVFGF